jgi:thymidine kinase
VRCFPARARELIRRLRRAEIARKRMQVFKPALDDRHSADEIVSRGGMRMKSEAVSNAAEILVRQPEGSVGTGGVVLPRN